MMNQSEFEKRVHGIPVAQWEKSLDIGRFKTLNVGRMETRPFSFIARCSVLGSAGEGTVYVKIHRNSKEEPEASFVKGIEGEYRVAEEWYRRFAESESFRVVRPLILLADEVISVTEESRGESIMQMINSRGRFRPGARTMSEMADSMSRVGEWLKFKGEMLAQPGLTYTRDEFIDYVDLRLKLLCDDPRRNFPGRYRERVILFVESAWPRIAAEDLRVATSHSDFNPGNILVNGTTVTVLDFGRLAQDSYLLDACKLYHQLSLWTFKPDYRSGTIRDLQLALLDGFENPALEHNLMFRLMYIRNTITHLMTTTRYWENSLPVRVYNKWVTSRELKVLQQLTE